MGKDQQALSGRPRSGQAAIPELARLKGLDLARWASGCLSGGLTMGATAQLCGYTRRHLQRVIAAHAHDALVQRHQLEAEALEWEREGGQALREATSRALGWLREASADPGTDPREVAAALGASIQGGHRLTEAGARRAKRLQPVEQQQGQRFDLEGFLNQIAAACNEVKALPEAEQEGAYEALRQRLKADQPQAIDVEVIEAQGPELEQTGPMASPLI